MPTLWSPPVGGRPDVVAEVSTLPVLLVGNVAGLLLLGRTAEQSFKIMRITIKSSTAENRVSNQENYLVNR